MDRRCASNCCVRAHQIPTPSATNTTRTSQKYGGSAMF